MELHLVVFRLGPCLMGSHRVPATHTFYSRKDIATPGNLHPQASTAVTHCLLIALQFTEHERMVTCINIESAAFGSRTRADGVGGEYVTTRPPAPCDYVHGLTLDHVVIGLYWK